MSMDALQQAKLFRAMARRLDDPKAALTATEEAAIAIFFPVEKDPSGLPAGPAGDAQGKNALRRTNWFNGRFLTAEALRRQDTYGDQRARLDAQVQMPGVAHGLGLSAIGLNALPVQDAHAERPPTGGGFGKAETITLSPGLAFDMIGRPILVSQPFDFTLEQLLSIQAKTPRRVAPGGTEFAPCICLVPEPAGPTGGSAAFRPGPYLLVIEPGETPEGEAKVYGEACAGAGSANCQADAWRGSFGLSLVRVPLELPQEPGLTTAWALRGTASAWWFDVFEHSLIRRWDPDYALDGGFAAPVGPARHEAGAVALAMVWLGTDGSAIFLDRWLPRRSIVATQAEDWHRTRLGAPPRAAAWARIHQFQAMLAESLAVAPLVDQQREFSLNLWQRGFRHIPPYGILPLDPAAIGAAKGDGASTGIALLDRIVAKGGGRIQLVSGLIAAARRQAFSYFRGTTVLPYCVVALHDDDVLEDLGNVFDKDPVRVARRLPKNLFQTDKQASDATSTPPRPANAFLEKLGEFFDVLGLDELVNRRTEIVKVVIPLQGLTRAHPVVGVVPEDARGQAAAWLGAEPPAWWSDPATLMDALSMAQLGQRMPLEMLPRHFAVYVKQRMVLLDVLVVLLELLQAVVTLARDTQRDAALKQESGTQTYGTATYYLAYAQQPAERRAMAEAVLAEPLVQAAVARAAVAALPDLRLPARNAEFSAKLAQEETALARSIADPAERQRQAMARVADSYAATYPGFAVVQLVAAVQPPDQAKAMVAAIAEQAAQQPLRDAVTGARAEGTVADSVAKDGTKVFADAKTASVYATLYEASAAKAAASYVEGAPEGITAADILAKPQAEAAQALGGDEKLAAFTAAMAKQAEASAAAAEAVTTAAQPEVVAKLAAAVAAGQDSSQAVESVRASVGADAAKLQFLDGAKTMIDTLGASRALDVARLTGLKGF